MLRTSNKFLLLSAIGTAAICAACATGGSTKYEVDADAVENEERVLDDTFVKVWRAAQLAMAEYPIRVNSQDSGTLETEFIKSDQGFRVPGQEKRGTPMGRRYRILIKVFPAAKAGSTQIVIRKLVEKQKDFFSGPEKTASDGLEELAIMYRVERELLIEQAAEKRSNGGKEKELDI